MNVDLAVIGTGEAGMAAALKAAEAGCSMALIEKRNATFHRFQRGFSLLEVLIAALILSVVLIGAVLLSRNSITSNSLSRDLNRGSSMLKSFVEDVRGLNPDSLPRNLEVVDSAGPYLVRWKIFDSTSASPYRQPAGLLLLNAKLDWIKNGRIHTLYTATLLTKQ